MTKPLCACLLLILSLFADSTYAQQASAALSGTVVDPSGAPVAQVAVTIEDATTGLRRLTATDDEGRFIVSSLMPSRVRVVAEKQGFQKGELPDVVLEVGDRVSLRITLQLGSIADAVTVTVETPRIRTTPGVATVVDRAFVEHLPMNGRTFQSLIQLTPGAVPTAATTTFGQATQMFNSIGGLNSLYQIGGPRALQLALRVRF